MQRGEEGVEEALFEASEAVANVKIRSGSGMDLCLGRDVVKVDFSGHKVWFDAANEQLVLMKKNVYYTLKLGASSTESQDGDEKVLSPPLNFVHSGPVLDAKFSLCGNFLAIQRSDSAVEVVDLRTATEARLRCRARRENTILRGGVLWLQSGESLRNGEAPPGLAGENLMCLVTRCGIEIHQMPNTKRNDPECRLVGSTKHSITTFWYLPGHQLLLLGLKNGTEMRPLQFQAGNAIPLRFARFRLRVAPKSSDLLLAKLYDSLCAVEMCIGEGKIRVYKLGREVSGIYRILDLSEPGNVGLSIVDNLICVHYMESQSSAIYDVQCENSLPCVAPEPMKFTSVNEGLDLYSTAWVFLSPNWILDAKSGSIWKLELALDDAPSLAVNSFERKAENGKSYQLEEPLQLIAFLLRRMCHAPSFSSFRNEDLYGSSENDLQAYSKAILLRALKEVMSSKENCDDGFLKQVFKGINDVYSVALV